MRAKDVVAKAEEVTGGQITWPSRRACMDWARKLLKRMGYTFQRTTRRHDAQIPPNRAQLLRVFHEDLRRAWNAPLPEGREEVCSLFCLRLMNTTPDCVLVAEVHLCYG